MARSALRWSVRELAAHSAVSASTIARAEIDPGVPNTTKANLLALKGVFEKAGIEFTGTPEDCPGVCVRGRD